MAKWPASLEDQCEGTKIHDGKTNLLNMMCTKRDNDNRPPPGQNSRKRSLTNGGADEQSNRKKAKYQDYGCQLWEDDPEKYPEGTAEKEFATQRQAIAGWCAIADVVDQWPNFFVPKNFISHVDKVMGLSCCEKMSQGFQGKVNN